MNKSLNLEFLETLIVEILLRDVMLSNIRII